MNGCHLLGISRPQAEAEIDHADQKSHQDDYTSNFQVYIRHRYLRGVGLLWHREHVDILYVTIPPALLRYRQPFGLSIDF